MSSLNKATIIGNLGKDPEVRHTQDGKAIVNLSIATSESWKDRATGERKEKTEWHRVVIFNEGLAKVAEQYLKKGSTIYIEGQLQTRKYTDKDGAEKYSTEVVLQNYRGELVMLGGKDAKATESSPFDSEEAKATEFRKKAASAFNLDDEIPLPKVQEPRRSFARDLDDEVPF
jgi:single-strand DNA-binding protein